MKLLWLVNIVMPELARHLGRNASVFGGWLTGAMEAVKQSGHQLVVCTTEPGTASAGRYEVNGVVYYLTARTDIDTMRRDFREILTAEVPDVVHVYGTEFEQAVALVRESDTSKTLVTIQGSLQYYKDAVYAGIPTEYCKDSCFHKILRSINKGGNSIELQKKSFSKRAVYECEILKKVKYINGGSAWGNAVGISINPSCTTLDCGLILRDSFYTDSTWDYDACDKHTIYALISYPIKGFHMLLDALPIVRNFFPDVKIRAIGCPLNIRKYGTLKTKIMDLAPDYHWYLQNKISELQLQEAVEFVGYLNEEQVKQHLLKSHIFVSPSSIENQSTALGEAMILGVPSIASCVGAMQEMIDHGRDGFLYPFHEPYLLADYICRIFESRALAEQFSRDGRIHAQRTYNKEENCRRLLEMYETVAAGSK